MKQFNNILVTGGCGFIGTNFIQYLFQDTAFQGNVINVDKLTYAGNQENLHDIQTQFNNRYHLEVTDICDAKRIQTLLEKYTIDCIVHFAAESHVDRSIHGPAEFITTNINGTFTLLNEAKHYWKNKKNVLFHHISTDEVYGSLGSTGYFSEETPYAPRSPYSASKAASDHLVQAYHHTYGLPVTISNCSNNYGPYQFPEKLIPLMITNMIKGIPLPIYGNGKNIRDWLYVKDHANAIWAIMTQGKIGETYTVGGENEWENIKLVTTLCEKVAIHLNKPKDHYKSLITYVTDRLGHDQRYAIDCTKIKQELSWAPSVSFEEGLDLTIQWYLNLP